MTEPKDVLRDATVYPAADQHAHVTYHDQATLLSFYWNGQWENGRIGISLGGYGENIIASIHGPRDDGDMLTFSERLRLFEVVCQRFVDGLDPMREVDMRGVMGAAVEYDEWHANDFLHKPEAT